MKNTIVIILALLYGIEVCGQRDFYKDYVFTEADTLRGMLRPERSNYDVTFYDLNIRIEPEKRSVSGYVDIHYTAVKSFQRLQIDLYDNMQIDRIVANGKVLTYQRRYDAVFIDFPETAKGSQDKFRVYYRGIPREANNPPWDGGFVWDIDRKGHPWVGVACEGDGASLWWPNKDHLSDEPDSMSIRVSVPNGLICVANGNLRSIEADGDYNRYHWFVSYPINNYNVTVNIGKYVHFSDVYESLDGDSLSLDYYVLEYNEEVARAHFKQVHKVLACFEQYFGKYPFWKDGYALVETPYLGMEHQSAIAYGNRYMRGYLGGMIPRDMEWDYIIVHETGHEYFGNSVSCKDLSEMWIHESFTTYMEALYVECIYSYQDAIRYLESQRPFIYNREPILGPKDVNWEDWQGSDHYFKGSWVLHTLRSAIDDDARWFDLLKGFYEYYALSHATTEDFVDYVNTCTGTNFTAFFEQYLVYPDLPVLEYSLTRKGGGLSMRYRWQAGAEGFHMPVKVGKAGNYQTIVPTSEVKELKLEGITESDFRVARELFLINTRRVNKF